MKDSDRLEPLVDPAIRTLRKIFTDLDVTDKEVSTARIAASALATWSRLKQSEKAEQALYFTMARELATDKAQLEAYIKISMPEAPIAPALPEGKKK